MTVDEVKAKTAALAETNEFLELLSQFYSNPALRLPLKAAIQQKVDRIKMVFYAGQDWCCGVHPVHEWCS